MRTIRFGWTCGLVVAMQVARGILVLTCIGDGMAEVIGVWRFRGEVVGGG